MFRRNRAGRETARSECQLNRATENERELMPKTKTTTDPYADLNALLDKPLTDWKPDTAGDRVAGTVVELGEIDGEHSTYPVVTLDAGDTLIRVQCSRKRLSDEVRGRDVRVGDDVAIQYEGEVKTVDGKRSYHSYRFAHKPAVVREEPPRVPSVHDDEPPAGYDDGEAF